MEKKKKKKQYSVSVRFMGYIYTHGSRGVT